MTDVKQAENEADKEVKTRSRTVKPGHLEVGEFTSGRIGASSPFGKSGFPLPISAIHYEHTDTVPLRHLDEEHH